MLHQVIERGQARGLFLVPDSTAVTILLWGLGVALAGWFPYAPAFTIEQLADSYADIFLRLMQADVAGPRGV
jgi:hypothetical protein